MDFFQPDTTYLLDAPYRAPEVRPEFRCIAIAVHPGKGEDRAFGFMRAGHTSPWASRALSRDGWDCGWIEVPVPADAAAFDYDDGLGDLGTAV